MVDALITYGWNRTAYNSLRSLTKNWVTVAVGDLAKRNMSSSSRKCSTAFTYDSFYGDPVRFVDQVCDIIRELKPKVYLPMHEETFIVARHIERFKAAGVKVPVADFDAIKTVHKKDSLNEIADTLGIPIPKTIKPDSLDDLNQIWKELSGTNKKVVIKELNTNSAKGISYANSRDDFIRKYSAVVESQRLEPAGYPIAQEYISGEGVGVSQLYNHGVLKASFTHTRLREKNYSGGTSTLRVSCRNPLLEEHSARLLTHLKWHGVVMTEYKYDPVQKKGWLLDVNPRYWGSLALAIKSGVDFPWLAYQMARDGDVAPVQDYREGVVVRWLLGDVMGTLSEAKARRSVMPFVRFFSMRQDGFDDLFADDPLAFAHEAMYYVNKMLRSRSLNPRDNALFDIDTL